MLLKQKEENMEMKVKLARAELGVREFEDFKLRFDKLKVKTGALKNNLHDTRCSLLHYKSQYEQTQQTLIDM